jgi:hypothetical protein
MKTQILFLITFILLPFLVMAESVILRANQDTYIRKNYSTRNWDGSEEGLEFGAKYGSHGQYRSIINWDVSAVPKDALVDKAVMIIHMGKKVCAGNNCLPEGELDIYRITAEWEESQATWQNRLSGIAWSSQGSDFAPGMAATQHVSGTGNYSFDITPVVQGWVDGTFPACGVMGEIRDHSNTTVWVGGAHNGAWFLPCDLLINYDIGTPVQEGRKTAAGPFLTIHPNPVRGNATILFRTPFPEKASLHIYDLKGCLIRTFLKNSTAIGNNTLEWNPAELNAGIYMVNLRSGNALVSKKVMCLK